MTEIFAELIAPVISRGFFEYEDSHYYGDSLGIKLVLMPSFFPFASLSHLGAFSSIFRKLIRDWPAER